MKAGLSGCEGGNVYSANVYNPNGAACSKFAEETGSDAKWKQLAGRAEADSHLLQIPVCRLTSHVGSNRGS
jgi:hypothetical protein